jgi:hypothetical protein
MLRPMGVHHLARAAALAVPMLIAGCAAAHGEPAVPPPSNVLYAVDGHATTGVVELDATTGKQSRHIAPPTRHGLQVASVARLDSSHLLVTYAKGPRFRSNVAGGDPEPGSCGGEVDRVDVSSRRIMTLWAFPASTRLQHAQPSPDGRSVALLDGPCVPSYFNSHVEVTDLRGHIRASLGAKLPRCHGLGSVTWTGDGKQLLALYAPASDAEPYSGSDGTCSEPQPAGLVTLDPAHSRPDLPAPTRPALRTCTLTAASAASGGGVFEVQACGRDALSAPVDLVRLAAGGAEQGRWHLDHCGNGTEMAVSSEGDVAISGYFYCAGTHDTPKTRLFTLRGTRLATVRTVPGGNLAFATPAW